MPNKFDTPALRELRAVFDEADAITSKTELTKREEARINVLLSKIAAMRAGLSVPDDSARRFMRDFIKGRDIEQRANEIEGAQTPSWSVGAQGGFLVPTEYHDGIIYGAAQFDPLLDKNVVTLIESKGFNLRPYRVPGWDLSTIAATKVAEGAQQTAGAVPAALAALLNGFTYRQTLAASFELEDDEFDAPLDRIQAAYGIAFARGIGSDLVNGDGTTGPQGILTGATNSAFTTATTGVLVNDDLDSIYFSVNEAYRSSKKCAWLMNDATYQIVRKAKDTSLAPLLGIVDDHEVLLGKPLHICPSMPGGATAKGIVFGDLSHYVVRLSKSIVKRNLQAAGYVENGLGLYTGLIRADAKVIDPTGGVKPPIVYATLR